MVYGFIQAFIYLLDGFFDFFGIGCKGSQAINSPLFEVEWAQA
jgi:hypothetical protein